MTAKKILAYGGGLPTVNLIPRLQHSDLIQSVVCDIRCLY
jgi:hypothetical protein